MSNYMKYWDSGFPVGSLDAVITNDMKFWDNGLV